MAVKTVYQTDTEWVTVDTKTGIVSMEVAQDVGEVDEREEPRPQFEVLRVECERQKIVDTMGNDATVEDYFAGTDKQGRVLRKCPVLKRTHWDREDVLVAVDWALERGFETAERWSDYSPNEIAMCLSLGVDPTLGIDTTGGQPFYIVTGHYQKEWSASAHRGEGWRSPAQWQEWFVKNLNSVARSCGLTIVWLVTALCSDDPAQLAGAYSAIGGYYGFGEFDQYPLQMSEEELGERWSQHG
jgi:hypothetical protein